LAGREKSRIFAVDFRRKSNEALYLRLAGENLRNFHLVQESMTASRLLAWAVVYFSTKRFSQDPHQKKWYTAPRFVFDFAQRGAEEQNKIQ